MQIPTSFLETSHLISPNTVTPAINKVAPAWLHFISEKIIASAKAYASRFGSASRKFWYNVSSAENEHIAEIFCSGPFVQTTAFDYTFSIPVGGFKYGDIDPLTKEPFPGGIRGNATYIILENKPETEGEKERAIARTYSKYSGQTITRAGFFSQSLRKNISDSGQLNEVSINNLKALALFVGEEIARNVGNQIKREYNAIGIPVEVIGPTVITTEY